MVDEHDHDHDHDGEELEGAELELDTQSQIFLAMRQQNLELLKIAVEVAGYGGQHPPLKSGDVRQAMKTMWDVYAELYSWIDPEESGEDDEGDDEE